MAKSKIVAGGILETLTPAEAAELVADALGQIAYRTVRGSGMTRTDGSGNAAAVDIYGVPLGYEFELTRMLVEADGVTPGAVFNAANGFFDILRGSTRVDFVSLAAGKGQIPASLTWSGSSAPLFRNGETVGFQISGGPASVNVEVRIQGRVRPAQSDE